MKKILYYIILFILLCFIIPVIFTKKNDEHASAKIEEQNIEMQEKTEYNYKQYSSIKLLHVLSGEVEELPLDEYIYGVVSSEMPASFENEALKAQAVVARTYTIYNIENNSTKHENADICDDSTCCQAWNSKEKRFEKWEDDKAQDYWDKIVNAVDSTKRKNCNL